VVSSYEATKNAALLRRDAQLREFHARGWRPVDLQRVTGYSRETIRQALRPDVRRVANSNRRKVAPAPARPSSGYGTYGDRKPYVVAERLDDLHGPSTGTVNLPPHLDWSGNASYDLDKPSRLATMYRTVLNEAGSVDDLRAWLDGQVLVQLWPTLWLPPQVDGSGRADSRSWPRCGLKSPSVDDFHQFLARMGLDAAERYGFALAGGYAVQAAGFLQRPSEDVDLFTVWERRGEFEAAVSAIVEAYRAAGLSVQAERRHDTFTRLTVSDDVQTAKVELGVDMRANEPVRIAIGPVLHPDDAVANKIGALYERAVARDFIDIDAVLQSGRYDRRMLLELAERADITFDRSVFAEALAQAQLLDADDFAQYGLVGQHVDGLRHRFGAWRAELLGDTGQAVSG